MGCDTDLPVKRAEGPYIRSRLELLSSGRLGAGGSQGERKGPSQRPASTPCPLVMSGDLCEVLQFFGPKFLSVKWEAYPSGMS